MSAGAGGEVHRVGEQCGPPLWVGAEFGGPAHPLGGDSQTTPADRQLGCLGQQVGDFLVRPGGRGGQMGGAAHQHVFVECGEVTVSLAALLRAGLMDDCGANQRMTKLNLPQWIHYEQTRIDGGLDVAHHIPRTVRPHGVDGDAVEGGPQQVGADIGFEPSQALAEYRDQPFGQRQCAAVVDLICATGKFGQCQWIAGRSRQDRGGGRRRQRCSNVRQQLCRTLRIQWAEV